MRLLNYYYMIEKIDKDSEWYLSANSIRKCEYCDIFKEWSRKNAPLFYRKFDTAIYFEKFFNGHWVWDRKDALGKLTSTVKRITPEQWYEYIYDWYKIKDKEIITEDEIKTAIENLTKLIYKKWRADWAKWMRDLIKEFPAFSRLLNRF